MKKNNRMSVNTTRINHNNNKHTHWESTKDITEQFLKINSKPQRKIHTVQFLIVMYLVFFL